MKLLLFLCLQKVTINGFVLSQLLTCYSRQNENYWVFIVPLLFPTRRSLVEPVQTHVTSVFHKYLLTIEKESANE